MNLGISQINVNKTNSSSFRTSVAHSTPVKRFSAWLRTQVLEYLGDVFCKRWSIFARERPRPRRPARAFSKRITISYATWR